MNQFKTPVITKRILVTGCQDFTQAVLAMRALHWYLKQDYCMRKVEKGFSDGANTVYFDINETKKSFTVNLNMVV